MDYLPPATLTAMQQSLGDLPERLQLPASNLFQLLREVIQRAVETVGAAGGSLLVPERDGHNLRFLASFGEGADKLAGVRVPLEGSIAGYVFSTGQMTAVGDLDEEKPEHFYEEVDKQTGVNTRSYLALPILIRGRSQGVATYINRPGKPPFRHFQPEEMELARGFTLIQGLLLQHLERIQQLGSLMQRELSGILGQSNLQEPTATLDASAEPWARVLQVLDGLPGEDQDLCADLVEFLGQRRLGGRS